MDLFEEQDAKRAADKLSSMKKRKRKAMGEELNQEDGDAQTSTAMMGLPMKKRTKRAADVVQTQFLRDSHVFKSLFDEKPSDQSSGKYKEDFMTRSAKFGLQ